MVIFQIIRERMNHTEKFILHDSFVPHRLAEGQMIVLGIDPGARLPDLSSGFVLSQLCDLRQVI